MSALEGKFQYSALLNRLILDRTTAEELGRVDDLWMLPQAHRVVGIIYKTGGFLAGHKQALTLSQLETIGPDAIMISPPTTTEVSEEPKQSESVIGSEVWTEGGSRVGRVIDYLFDPITGAISTYLFVVSGFSQLTDGTYSLSPDVIATIGKKRLLVTEAVAGQLVLHSEGLKQRLTGVVDQAKGLLEQTRDRVSERAKDLGGQAREALDQARERTQTLVDQAGERIQEARESVTQEATTIDVEPSKTLGSGTESTSESTTSRIDPLETGNPAEADWP